ncbi:MAG: sialidase family protein [Thermaerobacterales bacterium]
MFDNIGFGALAGIVITAGLAVAAFWWSWRLFRSFRPSRRAGRLDVLRNPGFVVLSGAMFLIGGVAYQILVAVLDPGPGGRNDFGQFEPGSREGWIPFVYDLEFDASAPDRLFLTTPLGLHRWQGGQMTAVSADSFELMGFTQLGDGALLASGRSAAGGSAPLGVLRSENDGLTWETVALDGIAEFHLLVAAGSGDDPVLYGLQGIDHEDMPVGVYRSTDGGRSWEPAASEGLAERMAEERDGIFALSGDPQNPDGVLAATAWGLLASDDGGDTWRTVVEFPVTAVRHDPLLAGQVFVYVPADGIGLVQWDLMDEDAQSLHLELGETDAVRHVAAHPANNMILFAGTFRQNLYMTEDAGQNWTQVLREGMPVQ